MPCPAVDGVHRAVHPRYCELVAERPDVWAAKVLARALSDAGMRVDDGRPAEPPRRELVIAHYRAPLAWVAKVPPAVDRITVYTRGGAPIGPDVTGDPRVRVVSRPGPGREAEVMAAHVAGAWDTLASDVTLFAQDNPFDHCPDFLGRLALPYDEPTAMSIGHPSAAYLLPSWVTDLDRRETHHGYEVRYGDATIHAHHGQPPWFNPAAWSHLFAGEMPRPLWFAYGAQWAVPKANLTHRPRAFWAQLAREIVAGERSKPMSSWTDPPLNPWAAEALWRYVFGDEPVRAGFVPQTTTGPAPARGTDPAASGLTHQQDHTPPTAGRQAVDRLTLALACDYRVPLSVPEQSACGCSRRGAALCLLGKSRREDGRVTLAECVACAGAG